MKDAPFSRESGSIQEAVVPVGGLELPLKSPDLEPSELLQLVRTISKHKVLLLLACLGGLAVALLLARVLTPLYQAHTLVEIQGINESYLGMRSLDPLAADETLAPSYLQTQLKILQTTTLLRMVRDSLELAERPELLAHKSRLSEWKERAGLPRPEPPDARLAALDWLRDAITVRALPETRLIEITATSTDRDLAAVVANRTAQVYIDQSLDVRWEAIKQTSEWITPKLDELRIKLENSEGALQGYAESSGVMFMPEGENSVAQTKLLQLELELSRAEGERVMKQTEYELASSTRPEFFPRAAEDAAAREYQVRLTDLRRQLAELRENFTPSHYRVQQVQAEIKELEAALAAEHATLTERIANSFKAAQRREDLLKLQYQQQARLVSDQAAKIVRYNILKHEVKSNQDIYELLLREMKEAGVASAMHANNIRVLDPAEPPMQPFSPNRKWYSVIGMVTGLFAGVVFIFARQHADRTLHNPGQTPRYLKVSELGYIPKIVTKKSAEPPKRRTTMLGIDAPPPAVDALAGEITPKTAPALVSWYDKSSIPAECFRSALASLRLSADAGTHPRIVVVTSAGPSEGKTTAVTNLGIALAEIEKSVLLVDADVHRPRLHSVFGLSNSPGLTTLLSDVRPVSEYLDSELARKTAVPGLFLLPSGPMMSDVHGLLNSERVPALLGRLKKTFGTVLIDTPPAMGASYARVLARLADAAILVIRAEQTTIEAAFTAYHRLMEDRIRVFGTILNGVELKVAGSYYDRRQGYYQR
jgi:capsular exopolysaccharide synthesis family protein